MKTLNPYIEIFDTLAKAMRYFGKVKSAHLLYADSTKSYYVDTSKEALGAWKNLYTLLKEK